MEWIFLALLAPLCWAFGVTILKIMRISFIKHPFGYLFITIPVMVYTLFLFFIEPYEYPGIKNIIVALTIGGIATFGYYFYVMSLKKEEVSKVTILFGLLPLVVLILSTIFLGERLSIYQYLAFIFIISGSMLISFDHNIKKIKVTASILLILLSILLYSMQDFLLKIGEETNFSTMMFFRSLGFVITVLFIWLISKNARKEAKSMIKSLNKKRLSIAYSAELLGSFGILFFFLAVQKTSVSLVALITGFQSFFVILIALVLTKKFPHLLTEAMDKKNISIKVISAVLMLIGLYLITI